MKIFKKRITRLIISITSYLLLIGTYWICPTMEMGNNIFKNIIILLVGQPILFILIAGFTVGLIGFFIFLFSAIVYEVFEWIMDGDK